MAKKGFGKPSVRKSDVGGGKVNSVGAKQPKRPTVPQAGRFGK